MQRVALGRPARARSFLEDTDGTEITSGTVHVTVRSDRTGATHVDDQPATHDATAGWVLDLPPAALAELDLLHCTWRYTAGSDTFTWSSSIEIAADVLFSLARARQEKKLADQPGFLIEDVRADAERALESRCHFAFVRRYALIAPRRFDDAAYLDVLEARAIAAARVDGAPVDPTLLTALTITRGGVVAGLAALPAGDLELGVEHGADRPPGGAEDACLLLASNTALDTHNPRLVRKGSDSGSFEVYYSAHAELGAFDIPAVEAFCRRVERTRLV